MQLRVEIRENVLRQLQDTPKAIARAIVVWRREAGEHVRREMDSVIASKQQSFGRTGQLRESIEVSDRPTGFAVGPTADYALFVDQPTRPHVIRPRHKKALAFASSIGRRGTTEEGDAFQVIRYGGKEARRGAIFAKHVNHPGTKGMRFIEETGRRVEQPVGQLLESALQREIDQLGAAALGRLGGA